MNNNIAIVTSGYFPVPASRGGAVEALDENILKMNEKYDRMKIVVFSCYDKKAIELSKLYSKTEFVFFKTPFMYRFFDIVTHFIMKNIFMRKKHLSYRYIFQRLFFIRKVAKAIHKKDYGKILIENHSSLFMCLKKYKNYEKYKDKFYYHLHNVVTNDYGCKYIIANCRKVIGVSNYINATLKKFLNEDNCNNYYVLKNKIDRDSFLQFDNAFIDSLKNKYNLYDKKICLFTGRLSKEKGFEELIKAFDKIHNKNICLLVVGSYYYKSGIKNKLSDEITSIINSNKNIIFTGYIEYSKISSVYKMADLVVLPSIWDDPAPLTVVESLTCCKALVTTKSGGIPEYAINDAAILLNRDEKLTINLKSCINDLLDNPEKINILENNARKLTSDWTIDNYYFDFCDLIEV